ncbi:DSBA-like thioredoxin domain protein [Methyloligella halotolerans]|uniref:DSBA-like thioredoxin domain protein n=1 Tax=Methyloligella halotolerans TaxID=1177755 RepID=A0A1E2RUZ6_9HYPH|nr:DsbA family protein [Methyloligella halotolerans]ODA65940.1 DSBA-like thioredoxin domain protein [Methyloligella halotolerans]
MSFALDRRTFLAATLVGAASQIASRSFAASDPLSEKAVFYDPEVPVSGNPKGDVTIVEYFDYQCRYCKEGFPAVARFVAEDGNIRHVLKDWPILGTPSLYASRLTLAAGKAHGKAFEALMQTKARLSEEAIDAKLAEAGFEVARLQRAYEQDKARVDQIISRNNTQAEAFGFFGTPAYVVGNVVLPGVAQLDEFKRAVDKARSEEG